MSLPSRLLASVLADPSRDNCAVYADHLVEQGDPRGELINLELALERPADAETRRAQKARRDALLAQHEARWWPWLERCASAHIKLRTRHGFVRELFEVPAERIARFPHAFDDEPLETLQIFGPGDPQLGQAGAWLPRLRRLRLSRAVDDRALHDLYARPEALALLELRSGIRPLFERRFPDPALAALEVVELAGLAVPGTPAWIDAHAGQLRELRLPHAGAEAVQSWIERGPYPRLEILELPFTPAQLVALGAAGERFPRLRFLALSHHSFEEAHSQALLDARLPSLVEVSLRQWYYRTAERLTSRYRLHKGR